MPNKKFTAKDIKPKYMILDVKYFFPEYMLAIKTNNK